MSSFNATSAEPVPTGTVSNNCLVTKVVDKLKGFLPRGGATITEVNDKVVVFGGANREQKPFQDAIVYSNSNNSDSVFQLVTMTGDIPMPRSGHSVAAYGKYLLLFGGIDFAEEAVYNDLYALDTDTYQWHYIGESGVEVTARNSHSMAVLIGSLEDNRYLVVYGGASPEFGPLGDTVYAVLPKPEDIDDISAFFVNWQSLSTTTTSPTPREMHGTHTTADTLFVSGGRNTSELLTEVWSLQIIETITNTTSSSGDTITVSSPVWTRQSEMDLEFPRCAHGSCFVQNKLCAFGGFTGDGISNEIIVCNINSNESSNCGNSGNHSSITVLNTSNSNSNSNISSGRWVSVIANKEIDTRFGACMCSVSLNMLTAISNSTKYSPLFCNNSKTRINEADNSSDRSMEKFGILLFGGVSMEKDYSDVLCLLLN